MRKLIGTMVIIGFFYVGFFGWEKYNVKPFIIEWLKSDEPEKLGKKAEEIAKDVKKTGEKVVDEADKAVTRIVKD